MKTAVTKYINISEVLNPEIHFLYLKNSEGGIERTWETSHKFDIVRFFSICSYDTIDSTSE